MNTLRIRKTLHATAAALALIGLGLAASALARAEQPAAPAGMKAPAAAGMKAPDNTCPPRDMADYKGAAQTESGRIGLATEGCGFKARQDINERAGRKRPAEQCGVEAAKVRDVLDVAGDKRALEFMRGNCIDSGARNG